MHSRVAWIVVSQATTSETLDRRYGRDRRSGGHGRRVLVAVGIAVVLVVAVVVWLFAGGGLAGLAGTSDLRTTNFQISGDRSVKVWWTVVGDDDSHLVCAVEALDEQRSVVGMVEVDLPAAPTDRSGVTLVKTAGLAVTGLLSSCRPA